MGEVLYAVSGSGRRLEGADRLAPALPVPTAEGVFTCATAVLATLAALPGCEFVEWLPCPEEWPEVGRC